MTSIASYLEAVSDFPSNDKDGWIYRGQKEGELPLVPKAGRKGFFNFANRDQTRTPHSAALLGESHHRDLVIFNEWREQAVAYDRSLPNADLEALAYAQHYGLATRLLDWTTNALVALFFAVESESNQEGAVFAYQPWSWLSIDRKLETIVEVSCLHVRPFDRRLSAQSGCFTYHPFPHIAFEERPLWVDGSLVNGRKQRTRILTFFKIPIPADKKKTIKADLAKLGFTYRSMFPDLIGLGQHQNWKLRRETKIDAILDAL